MTLTKAELIAEIVGLLAGLILIEWWSTVLTHTRSFWAIVVSVAICLGVRVVLLARKPAPR